MGRWLLATATETSRPTLAASKSCPGELVHGSMKFDNRPGYRLVFTMTIRLKNGKVIRRGNGRPFAFWVKI
jgi:hypothetical protein